MFRINGKLIFEKTIEFRAAVPRRTVYRKFAGAVTNYANVCLDQKNCARIISSLGRLDKRYARERFSARSADVTNYYVLKFKFQPAL